MLVDLLLIAAVLGVAGWPSGSSECFAGSEASSAFTSTMCNNPPGGSRIIITAPSSWAPGVPMSVLASASEPFSGFLLSVVSSASPAVVLPNFVFSSNQSKMVGDCVTHATATARYSLAFTLTPALDAAPQDVQLSFLALFSRAPNATCTLETATAPLRLAEGDFTVVTVPTLSTTGSQTGSPARHHHHPGDYEFGAELSSDITLRWTALVVERKLVMALECRTTGWCAVALSPDGGMLNSDAFVVTSVKGLPVVDDYFITSRSLSCPGICKDAAQGGRTDTHLIRGSTQDGILMVEFVRPFECDAFLDYPITEGLVSVVFAMASDNEEALSYHGRTSIGSARVDFFTGESEITTNSNSGMMIAHAVLMPTAWCFLTSVSVFCVRNFPSSEWSYNFHRWAQTAVLVVSVVGGILSIVAIPIHEHGRSLHGRMGLAFGVLASVQGTAGNLLFYRCFVSFWTKSAATKALRSYVVTFHRVNGRMVVVLSLITAGYGTVDLGLRPIFVVVYVINCAMAVLAFSSMELLKWFLFQRFRRKTHPQYGSPGSQAFQETPPKVEAPVSTGSRSPRAGSDLPPVFNASGSTGSRSPRGLSDLPPVFKGSISNVMPFNSFTSQETGTPVDLTMSEDVFQPGSTEMDGSAATLFPVSDVSEMDGSGATLCARAPVSEVSEPIVREVVTCANIADYSPMAKPFAVMLLAIVVLNIIASIAAVAA